MKAAVLYEVNKPLVIEEIDIDEPGPGRVMVKTVSAGVCHSDLHQIEGLWPIDLASSSTGCSLAWRIP